MAQSIESKIRVKAAVIYMIVALVVAGVMLYFNNLRENILYQRNEVESQYTLLSATNDLILAVSDVQSLAGLYISTKDRTLLNNYAESINHIEDLIDTLVAYKPNEEEKLHRIAALLKEQSQNIQKLNLQLAVRNPMELLSERLRDFHPYVRSDTVYTLNITRDTMVTEVTRQGFMRRLGAVFNPSRDSITTMVMQSTDTIRTIRVDSLAIMYEVEAMAEKAREEYERNMRMIERQVGELMRSNRDIATEVFALLLEFHSETLQSTLSVIDESESAIEDNYRHSTSGGIFALGLILVFMILIITDINKGRKARSALERANERTRQIMESRHKLLLSVSHDIKTPLHSILGYLALMESDADVSAMQHSSEHILSMLENLLEFSNLEQGTLQKSDSDFNLQELFNDIREMFLPLANQKSLSFLFEVDDVRVHTDRVKFKQIVINLVSNAIKYTQNGEVFFSAHFNDGQVGIKVSDTGVGIPPEKRHLLFLPFSRIEENSTIAEGSGLGMFVVHGLVSLFGGEINIDSKVGAGTTITIVLPVERAPCEISKGAKRIKVIDDNPVLVKMVSDMLLKLGHKVVDGELISSDCDLVITDWEMGDVTGLDILHKVGGSVPVILMTGQAHFTAQKARELGFDHFLAKPFTLESLREVVGEGAPPDDLLGDHRDEIVEIFRTSTKEAFIHLKQALAENNFRQAQSICHKISPMFVQLGYPSELLCKMDAHRNDPYDGWREDVAEIVTIEI